MARNGPVRRLARRAQCTCLVKSQELRRRRKLSISIGRRSNVVVENFLLRDGQNILRDVEDHVELYYEQKGADHWEIKRHTNRAELDARSR